MLYNIKDMESRESETLNSRKQLTGLIDGLIATVIRVDEYYPPKELERRLEQLQLLKGQVNDAGYDEVLKNIGDRIRDDEHQVTGRISHYGTMMEKIMAQRHPNQIIDEIKEWMGGRLLNDMRKHGHLHNVAGIIFAWRAEDIAKKDEIGKMTPSEN